MSLLAFPMLLGETRSSKDDIYSLMSSPPSLLHRPLALASNIAVKRGLLLGTSMVQSVG